MGVRVWVSNSVDERTYWPCVHLPSTADAADAALVDAVASGFDSADPYSRREQAGRARFGETWRLAVPRLDQLQFFGDEAAASHMYFELQAGIRRLQEAAGETDAPAAFPPAALAGGGGATPAAPAPPAAAARPKASERWADSGEMLKELKLEQYAAQFEEEEMTSIELLEEIVSRGDGEKELMDALKEMGIKKMGHRQAIVGAVVGKLL